MKKIIPLTIITIVLSYLVAFMKIKGMWLGIFLLEYFFLPISLFLIIDGVISIIKDNRYFVTRILRVMIGTSVFTIHFYLIFFI